MTQCVGGIDFAVVEAEDGGVAVPGERSGVADASHRGTNDVLEPALIAGLHGSHAPLRIAAATLAERLHPGILGGDVDVEGAEVFGDALPDPLDLREFGVTEARGISVKVVSRADDRIAAVVERVPIRAAGHVSVEIEIDGVVRPGETVQLERVRQRCGCRRGRSSGICRDRFRRPCCATGATTAARERNGASGRRTGRDFCLVIERVTSNDE